ncbi:MAG: DUF4783 domain-containing protein [Flavipsychrobacter sp.]|nr:DUF4783 domain-containing protein [Flavipsychrobacter sp.]
MITLSFAFLFTAAQAQTALEDVSNGVRTGNVMAIAPYFDNIVPITINNAQSTYSRQQAEMILKDFFTRNVPKEFLVANSGTSNNAKYIIGELITTTGVKYSVYILLKEREHVFYLQELRLNK